MNTRNEYLCGMADLHPRFPKPRQAERYVHAVGTWIHQLGFGEQVLAEFGPSILGEIAQAVAVTGQQEGEAWLEPAARPVPDWPGRHREPAQGHRGVGR